MFLLHPSNILFSCHKLLCRFLFVVFSCQALTECSKVWKPRFFTGTPEKNTHVRWTVFFTGKNSKHEMKWRNFFFQGCPCVRYGQDMLSSGLVWPIDQLGFYFVWSNVKDGNSDPTHPLVWLWFVEDVIPHVLMYCGMIYHSPSLECCQIY